MENKLDKYFKIEDYKAVNGGALKGKFTLVIQPGDLEIRECCHFETGDKSWFNLTQKESKNPHPVSGKTQYYPLAKFKNATFWASLKEEVEKKLKQMSQGAQNAVNAGQTNLVQGDAQPVWF
jgi:hypothetical protein